MSLRELKTGMQVLVRPGEISGEPMEGLDRRVNTDPHRGQRQRWATKNELGDWEPY